jgi:hypothetical protein
MSNGQIASIFQWVAIAASIAAALSGGVALHFRNRASVETADMLSATIGKRWLPLTSRQIELLTKELETTPKYPVQLMYLNQLGKDLAESIHTAFIKAGWNEQVKFMPGAGNHFGIIAGAGTETAAALKVAIEKSTTLKVELDKPNVSDRGLVYLFIGINR